MGVLIGTAQFLVHCSRTGVCFRRTLTIGRQNLYVDLPDFEGLFRAGPDRDAARRAHAESEFLEPFLRLLGAEDVESLDASDYEGATIVHDLCGPVPDRLRGRYDAVVECGSLEHIFDFPAAVRNCMEMVRVGGHLLIDTPANNQCGHGLYQFSPELFWRVLAPANGFEVERMLARECYADAPLFEVADPAAVGTRVELLNDLPLMLLIRARRTHEAPIFAAPPRQSDYVRLWSRGAPARPAPGPRPGRLRSLLRKALGGAFPRPVGRIRRALYARKLGRDPRTSFRNREFFKEFHY